MKIKKPQREVSIQESMATVFDLSQEKFDILRSFADEKYKPYEDFRLALAGDFTKADSEILWPFVRFLRERNNTESPVKSPTGQFFTYNKLKYFDKLLHEIDMQFGRQDIITKAALHGNLSEKELILNSIIEEAVASSQIEGASTTREKAKEMLKTGRKPRDQSEQMIGNNFEVIKSIEDELGYKPLSKSLLFEMHKKLMSKTRNDWDDIVERFRRDEENIVVQNSFTGVIYHTPPLSVFVEKEIDRLIEFANSKENVPFVHPLIKAIILHFWIGYLHPFVDGNGRLARALFYWSMLNSGYTVFGYLPISRVIKVAKLQYSMAYVNTEQDNNDLSYFLDFNLKKVSQAIDEFRIYVNKKQEAQKILAEEESKFGLNSRQMAGLIYLKKESGKTLNINIYKSLTQSSLPTAIKDLKELETKKIVTSKKVGRERIYRLISKPHQSGS